MAATAEQLGRALEEDPTLLLLNAYSRGWVVPLFAEQLEPVEGSVSAEWFHERVAEALETVSWKGERSPAEHCRKWVDDRWLDTEYEDGRLRYRISAYALRAIQIVRELVDGQSAVTGARMESIAHAVHTLAAMTNPDREAQAQMIDEQILELTRKRDALREGQLRLATVDEMQQQLAEILTMTRTLPADFRHLRTLVENRHQQIARRALTDGPGKAELVEEYLHQHDLLAETVEGRAYKAFANVLTSTSADTIRDDIDQILSEDFAQTHMTAEQREQLETMFSTLLSEQLRVQRSYLRWTSSLRRTLTRSAHGPHRRILTLIDQALSVGSDWVATAPGRRNIDTDILRIGVVAVPDTSTIKMWRQPEQQTMTVSGVPDNHSDLPGLDRAALRLAAGTSPKAITATINALIASRHLVTGADVFDATPAEFQRLGALVTLLDLAVSYGQVDGKHREHVRIAGDSERALRVILPHLVFDTPIYLSTAEQR